MKKTHTKFAGSYKKRALTSGSRHVVGLARQKVFFGLTVVGFTSRHGLPFSWCCSPHRFAEKEGGRKNGVYLFVLLEFFFFFKQEGKRKEGKRKRKGKEKKRKGKRTIGKEKEKRKKKTKERKELKRRKEKNEPIQKNRG